MTIIFYDIPSKKETKAWSPNTFKARIALNFKGVPYKTEWVEYPDIEGLLKKIGGAPTSKKADGRDHYTLPAIYDEATGEVVTDSMNIAIYLDETYPDKPLLFPFSTRAAVEMFNAHFMELLGPSLLPILLSATCYSLNPPSEDYFRATREASYMKPLAEISPAGPVREEHWSKVKAGLARFAAYYEKNGIGKPYFFGDTFTYADAIIAGFLVWVQIILGPEGMEWKELASLDGGRWGRLLETIKKELVVD